MSIKRRSAGSRIAPLSRHLLPAVLAALLWSQPSAHADIYVGDLPTGTTNDVVRRYTNAGAAVNTSFIPGQSSPYDLALSGGNIYVLNGGNGGAAGSVRVYNATTGAAVNTSFITGLSGPLGIEIAGSSIYIASDGDFSGTQGHVAKYDLATGAVVNANFVTGLNYAEGLAVSGNTLYVAEGPSNKVGAWDATTGTLLNANLVTGLSAPEDIKVSGSTLYIPQNSANKVGTYNATTGAAINANFITNVGVWGIDLAGNSLYVTNAITNDIGEYNATTGAAINAARVTGLSSPFGVAVSGVPEPATWAGGLGVAALLGLALRRQRARLAPDTAQFWQRATGFNWLEFDRIRPGCSAVPFGGEGQFPDFKPENLNSREEWRRFQGRDCGSA